MTELVRCLRESIKITFNDAWIAGVRAATCAERVHLTNSTFFQISATSNLQCILWTSPQSTLDSHCNASLCMFRNFNTTADIPQNRTWNWYSACPACNVHLIVRFLFRARSWSWFSSLQVGVGRWNHAEDVLWSTVLANEMIYKKVHIDWAKLVVQSCKFRNTYTYAYPKSAGLINGARVEAAGASVATRVHRNLNQRFPFTEVWVIYNRLQAFVWSAI